MNQPNEMELAACIGLDWADQRHVICLQAAGSPEAESLQLEQKPDALHEWIAQLRVRFQGAKVGIAIESIGKMNGVFHPNQLIQLIPLAPLDQYSLGMTP